MGGMMDDYLLEAEADRDALANRLEFDGMTRFDAFHAACEWILLREHWRQQMIMAAMGDDNGDR